MQVYKLTCVKVASYIFAASLLVVDSGNPSPLQALKLIVINKMSMINLLLTIFMEMFIS